MEPNTGQVWVSSSCFVTSELCCCRVTETKAQTAHLIPGELSCRKRRFGHTNGDPKLGHRAATGHLEDIRLTARKWWQGNPASGDRYPAQPLNGKIASAEVEVWLGKRATKDGSGSTLDGAVIQLGTGKELSLGLRQLKAASWRRGPA